MSGTESEVDKGDYVEKLIISVGVVGGTHTPDASPHLPLSPEEIAESAYEAHLAGAAVAHIHVRDDDGVPCHDLERYQKVIDLIGERCDMIVNLTTDLRDEDGAKSLAPTRTREFPRRDDSLGRARDLGADVRAQVTGRALQRSGDTTQARDPS